MQPIASLRPGTKAAVLGEIKTANLAVTRRRGFKIFHAVRRRRERRHPLHVDEPGVPRRHPQAAPAGGRLRRRQARLDRPALPEPRVRARLATTSSSVHTGRDRAVLREDRHGHAQHAAATGAAGARSAAAGHARSAARGAARPAAARAAPGGARGGALSAERGIGRGAQRVSHAGAAAADLRGVLPVSDRPRLAAAREQRRAEAVRADGRRSDPRVGGQGPAVQAHAGAAAGA